MEILNEKKKNVRNENDIEKLNEKSLQKLQNYINKLTVKVVKR